MWFSRKQVPGAPPGLTAAGAERTVPAAGGAVMKATKKASGQVTTKSRGDAAEALARTRLTQAGLVFVEANYRTPGRGGGEIDLVMRARDGTLVFVEVRHRADSAHGGAGASIGAAKRQRIVLAARHYLMRFASPPPCRFDAVLIEGDLRGEAPPRVDWLPAAFDAS